MASVVIILDVQINSLVNRPLERTPVSVGQVSLKMGCSFKPVVSFGSSDLCH